MRSYSAQEIAEGAKSGEWARLNEKNGAVFKPSPVVAFTQPASAGAEPGPGPVSLSSVLPS